MNKNRNTIWLVGLVGFIFLLGNANGALAQEKRQTFPQEEVDRAKRADKAKPSKARKTKSRVTARAQESTLRCTGPIKLVTDVGFEGLKFTSANYFASPGGGEGGGFDKTPVLSAKVRLNEKDCLDAHLSAIVGSRQTYGVAPITLFQVTLTPENGGPRHMVGHYERPYGSSNGPAVALEAERDVDMYASNFFQKVGKGRHEVPPGTYRVDVWWSGNGIGGAIGAAFVLKLYHR